MTWKLCGCYFNFFTSKKVMSKKWNPVQKNFVVNFLLQHVYSNDYLVNTKPWKRLLHILPSIVIILNSSYIFVQGCSLNIIKLNKWCFYFFVLLTFFFVQRLVQYWVMLIQKNYILRRDFEMQPSHNFQLADIYFFNIGKVNVRGNSSTLNVLKM